jgi:hypothetical protein
MWGIKTGWVLGLGVLEVLEVLESSVPPLASEDEIFGFAR